jgi:hypothetical protein
LHIWQIDVVIIQNALGRCAELYNYFKGMVNRLYDMFKKDGLKDLNTGKPAINFIERDSFVQKLHGNAQEFQMAVIIVKSFFMKYIKHQINNVEYWSKESSNPAKNARTSCSFTTTFFPVSQWQ